MLIKMKCFSMRSKYCILLYQEQLSPNFSLLTVELFRECSAVLLSTQGHSHYKQLLDKAKYNLKIYDDHPPRYVSFFHNIRRLSSF